MQTVSTLRAKAFFERQLGAFPFEWYKHTDFHYEVVGRNCHFEFQAAKKWLTQLYTLSITMTRLLDVPDSKATYHFQKKRWVGDQALAEIVAIDFHELDFSSVTLVQQNGQATLQMTLIPGSYTALLLPPLKQGIPLLNHEVAFITAVIEQFTKGRLYVSH